MEEKNITTTTTKGIVIGLILVILGLVTYFANLDYNGPIKYIGYVVFVGGIIWSVNSYGKEIQYNSTFGNYFAHGFKVAAFVTSILIIYVVIFNALFPDFKQTAMDEARKAMVEKNMTSEQMNQALEMTNKFFMVFVIGGTLLGYLIFGALSSLVGAAITKKDPKQFEEHSNQIGQ